MDNQTKAAILAIAVIIPISSAYVWNSDQSFVSASSGTAELSAIVSFYPLYEFTKQVGQDKVNVSLLIPPGIEPHDWEPTVNELQKMHEADLIVINGIGFESWADDIDTVNSDVIIVDTSKGISLIIDDAALRKDTNHFDRSTGDPHIWLNPVKAKTQVQNILDAIVLIDPENEKFYKMLGSSLPNSSLLGRPERAPITDMHCDARKLPITAHSLRFLFCESPERKPAANASPAPVVSTTVVIIGSTDSTSSPFDIKQPFLPRVIATIWQPLSMKNSEALS